jgi:hypothetical protein
VVSEETGRISIANNGRIELGIDKNQLANRIDYYLNAKR